MDGRIYKKEKTKMIKLTLIGKEVQALEHILKGEKPRNVQEYRMVFRALSFENIDQITDTSIKIRNNWIKKEELYRNKKLLEEISGDQSKLISEAEKFLEVTKKTIESRLEISSEFIKQTFEFYRGEHPWKIQESILTGVKKYRLLEGPQGVVVLFNKIIKRIEKEDFTSVKTKSYRLIQSLYILCKIMIRIYEMKTFISYLKSGNRADFFDKRVATCVYIRNNKKIAKGYLHELPVVTVLSDGRKIITSETIVIIFNRWCFDTYKNLPLDSREITYKWIFHTFGDYLKDIFRKNNVPTKNNHPLTRWLKEKLRNSARYLKKVSQRMALFAPHLEPKKSNDGSNWEKWYALKIVDK